MGKKTKEGEGGGGGASASENIKVLVRCRPLNSKETEAGFKPAVDLDLAESTVTVNHVCGNPDRWTFDAVINNTYSQKDIFVQYIMPLIDSVMDGFNATVFAYGQSGSGKTHTMTGKIDDEALCGIIPRTFSYVFDRARHYTSANPGRKYTLYCSFIELYNGKVRDLLAKQQVTLAVKENKDKSFFVQGCHIPQVKFPEEFGRHIEEGTERRQVASTELNADSSRSHSIFTVIVECTETSEDGDVRSVTSKFNLVDLAGSERQGKTGATGDTLKEGCNINLSLSALGTVIDTIVKGKGHVPFRSSPLTMLLKDSLGGSSKTVMFANIGPSEHNVSETVSTLRFADRAKQIKNKPVVNLDTKDQKIAELTEQVADLKERLKKFESGGTQDLEKEVEALTAKVDELQIDLDNVKSGREADTVEHEAVVAQLRGAMSDNSKAIEDLREQLAQAQQEAQLAEEAIGDERGQREEIFRACAAHFGAAAGAVATVEDLIHLLDEARNGQPNEEHEQAVAQLREALVAAEGARDRVMAELAELQAVSAQQKGDLDQYHQRSLRMENTTTLRSARGGNDSIGSPSRSMRASAQDAHTILGGAARTTSPDGDAEGEASFSATSRSVPRRRSGGALQRAGSGLSNGPRLQELADQNAALQQQLEALRTQAADAQQQFLERLLAAEEGAPTTTEEVDASTPSPSEGAAAAGEPSAPAIRGEPSGAGQGVQDKKLRAAVSLLQQEKKALLAEVGRLERALQDSAAAAAAAPPAADVGQMSDDEGGESGGVLPPVAALALPAAEDVEASIAAANDEAAQERERREKSEAGWQGAMHELTAARTELADARQQVAAAEAKLAEERARHARESKSTEAYTAQISSLEERLKERAGQLADLRAASDRQRAMIKESKSKTAELSQVVTELKRQAAAAEAAQADLVAEKQAAMQRAANARLEQIAGEHRRELERKDDEKDKVRKKIKKMEGQVQKAKERFDEKVCEYEDLLRFVEEQKVDMIRLVQRCELLEAEQAMMGRGGGAAGGSSGLPPRPTIVSGTTIQETQHTIQDALQRAKEERQRRNDLFNDGEATSSLAQVRAAGNAANILRSMPTTTPPSGSLSRRPPSSGGGRM